MRAEPMSPAAVKATFSGFLRLSAGLAEPELPAEEEPAKPAQARRRRHHARRQASSELVGRAHAVPYEERHRPLRLNPAQNVDRPKWNAH